jgi:GDP-D-mannose dehydratase
MSNFFQKKKILITGVDGFVGSNLAKHLIGLGSKIFGLAKNNKKESLLYYENLIGLLTNTSSNYIKVSCST